MQALAFDFWDWSWVMVQSSNEIQMALSPRMRSWRSWPLTVQHGSKLVDVSISSPNTLSPKRGFNRISLRFTRSNVVTGSGSTQRWRWCGFLRKTGRFRIEYHYGIGPWRFKWTFVGLWFNRLERSRRYRSTRIRWCADWRAASLVCHRYRTMA